MRGTRTQNAINPCSSFQLLSKLQTRPYHSQPQLRCHSASRSMAHTAIRCTIGLNDFRKAPTDVDETAISPTNNSAGCNSIYADLQLSNRPFNAKSACSGAMQSLSVSFPLDYIFQMLDPPDLLREQTSRRSRRRYDISSPFAVRRVRHSKRETTTSSPRGYVVKWGRL